MSAVKQLTAEARDRVGKGAARAVRRQGRIPAVIYGGGTPPEPISLDANQMNLLIYGGGFLTTIFEVEVGGQKNRVIPRDYHLDPVRDVPLHVDFLRVSEGQTLTVEVPVHFLNGETSPGIKAGGVLNIVRHAIELVVPTDAIPDAIEVDLSDAAMGDSIHISAVTLPPNVKPTVDRDFTIATIAAPAGLGADVEAEEAAVSEAAKAESAEAKASDES